MATLSTKLAELKPGDMLGFSGDGCLGWSINLHTLGWPFGPRRWRGLSHVAMVSEDPFTGRLVLWESTTLVHSPCVHCKEIHDGLQCHLIRSRVATYPGAVWHYPLATPLDGRLVHALSTFFLHLHGAPYDYFGALNSRVSPLAWLWGKCSEQDLHSLFCSEAVAAGWTAARIWKETNASTWNPNHLARHALKLGIVKKPIRLR